MAGPTERTAPPPSAAVRAYEHTKRLILTGELAGGAAVSELAIGEALGVSRTPTHEAFLRLATEGLLVLESRKGAVVRPMSPSETADVLEMREAVESAAAARVIESGYDADLVGHLTELLAAQERALRDGDVERFVDIDDDLHSSVVAASRNAIAAHFMAMLRDRQQRLRHQLMRVRPEQLEPAYLEHRQLAAAIGDRDADAYRTLLHHHISVHKVVL
ncbi:FCD domain-containing protein [Nakamurella sp. YIM 132087]|uniref:FCD domain-containing protein n=1 Tax=Nakamurella alba TaxID=2665158 RepID=A0A7K1FQ90_9ACTN|nr:GntR family transcriptional regulator [Nakamurella alba]MTD16306.1 FCD domain-containing protein [Nakamurella alba]